VAAIIEAAESHWGFAPGIEITLEANPSSVEASRFADLASAGVNRVSLGLQSLDDEALRFLGRAHDLAEGIAALETAQRVFERASFDLIYALPSQTEAQWSAELQRALSFGTGHLSLYQLTVERGTRFGALAAKGELPQANPDHAASLYELTQSMAEGAGIPAYEISNHARPGQESRHNLAYWRYQSYLGIGPGAHGRRGGSVTQRHKKPENWLSALARNGHGIADEQVLTGGDKAAEAILMGLRLREGIDLGRIARMAGKPANALVHAKAVEKLEAQGLLASNGGRLRATAAGMLLLDAILAEIVLV
jgi:oxygen-independent coproporphyrinogen-3 oxidase